MKDFIKLIVSFLTHRLFVISIFLVLMFSILLARLFELQIINGTKLEEEFELSVIREIDIEGQRGLIYDRNGQPLAINEIAYTVTYDNSVYTPDRNKLLLALIRILEKNNDKLNIEFPIILNKDNKYEYVTSPTKVNRFKNDVFGDKITNEKLAFNAQEMIEYLKNEFFVITDKEIEEKKITSTEFFNLITIRYALWLKGYYKFIPQEIASNISIETLAEIKENKDILPGVSIIEDPIRRYLYPDYMAHIVGYTGTISTEALVKFEPYGYNQNDIVGRIGIEEAMELYLHSQDGKQIVEVDNLGRTMNIIEQTDSIAGKDVYLTIDLDMQIAAQELLVKQLCNLVSQKLVLKLPGYGETRLPLLKDVYYSLIENNTINLEKILTNTDELVYTNNIMSTFTEYYDTRLLKITEALEFSNVTLNEELDRYFDYFLKVLQSDGYLNSEYSKSTGFLDYTNGNISFNGLLNYLIKDNYIDIDKELKESGLDTASMTDAAQYSHLMNNIIKEYYELYEFKRNIFLEMVFEEEFNYVDLSMLLIEQNIVFVDQEIMDRLIAKKLKPLDFMKQLILDVKLTPQQIAQDPSTGAVVIVDVDTGEVLSLVSYPSYDNNKIADYSYYQELLEDPTKPLYPTATQGKTAPGSTFKMMSAVAGLEEGVIAKHDYVTCTGHFEKVTPSVACWISAYGGGHGSINVVTAIAVSCNSFFNEVGYRLGITEEGNYSPKQGVETLAKYASMFGLNTTTGIELIESKPSLPGSVEGGIVNPVTAAMGQEYNSYTPTQMARYIATLANGGTLYELTLIDRIYNSDGTMYLNKEPEITQVNNFSEETIALVHQGMLDVTTGVRGTARTFYFGFPVLVAGKTGTAQENKVRASHAVFASFAPANNPEIAIVVAIPYSYTAPFSSGYIVGTVARDLYGVYYDIYGEKPLYEYKDDLITD